MLNRGSAREAIRQSFTADKFVRPAVLGALHWRCVATDEGRYLACVIQHRVFFGRINGDDLREAILRILKDIGLILPLDDAMNTVRRYAKQLGV